MTKKHFIALADHIRDSVAKFNAIQIESLADFCKGENPRFDRERWLGYIKGTCGKNGGKVKVG